MNSLDAAKCPMTFQLLFAMQQDFGLMVLSRAKINEPYISENISRLRYLIQVLEPTLYRCYELFTTNYSILSKIEVIAVCCRVGVAPRR